MTTVDFYDKEQVDNLLDVKADAADVYDKAAIDAKNIGAPDDTASESGSLWARIKNAVARIISLETADSNNIKKTGTSTVTGTLEVPTTPPTPTSAVNSVYVNDATEGVNNIVHKTGSEKINGNKILVDTLATIQVTDINYSTVPTNAKYKGLIKMVGSDDQDMIEFVVTKLTSGKTRLQINIKNTDGTWKYGVASWESDN